MKQGILITAYKDFKHLIDIANCFDANFEIYIHIDKKSTVEETLINELIAFENIKLVSRKYKVNWGGRNHLKCILHLTEAALTNKDISTFHLISGHDYPIKSTTYFQDFFNNNEDNYLSYFELPSKKWPYGGNERIYYYNLYDIIDAKKYRKYIFKFVDLQRRLNIKRPLKKNAPKLYGGDTWWSLNRNTVEYVIKYTKDKPYLLKRLKYSFCSEEIYFQTVIMNSEHSKNVVNDSMRYIDWSNRNGNFPANLDLSDWEKINSSDKLFARKFSLPISEPLKLKITNLK